MELWIAMLERADHLHVVCMDEDFGDDDDFIGDFKIPVTDLQAHDGVWTDCWYYSTWVPHRYARGIQNRYGEGGWRAFSSSEHYATL